jgi:mono/diheme cytochrome c family protein
MKADPSGTTLPVPDEAEPTAGSAPLPVWLVALFLLLFYWAQVFVDRHDGEFAAGVYSPFTSPRDLKRANRELGKNTVALGRELFTSKGCLACHQANGQGTPGQFPPLAGSEWVLAPEPGRIIRIVLNGALGEIQVKGQTFNNVMFPLRDLLTDEETAAVLTFIRKEWGNKAPEVKPERVRDVRERTKNQFAPWNPADLLNAPEGE